LQASDGKAMASYVVRYGAMRLLGVFTAAGDRQYARGANVIVRTDRGLEVGQVLCEASQQVIAQLKDAGEGQILRPMTAEDALEAQRIGEQAEREFEVCRQYVDKLGLEMDLVDLEHIFGGERIIVYYLAENRVDFRELVRLLAGEFQTRIEMRQIGVRDEAKLLADYGDCGLPVCCNTHLVEMPPVSMKMAKLQKATLDPTKISGRCGRLKCCLRYEYDLYEQIQEQMPPLGSTVRTPEGIGKVVGQELLPRQVIVQLEDQRRAQVALEAIKLVSPPGSKSNDQTATAPNCKDQQKQNESSQQ
jgi:cell fate regulator YaaT (PSP1 superfamily)